MPEEIATLQDIAAVTSSAEITDVEPKPADDSASSDNDAEKTKEEQKKKNWAQRRIDELTRQRHDAERDRDAWRDLATKQPAESKKPETQTVGKPKQADFTDYDAYVEALVDWKASAKASELEAKRAKDDEVKSREQKERSENERVNQSWHDKQAKAREVYDDFDEVISNPDIPLTPAMTHAILRSKIGAEMAYYLGKNEAEARRIANLFDPDGTETLLEMGKIASRIADDKSAGKEPVQTKAPKPPSHITQASKTDKALRDDLGVDEWHDRWLAARQKG